MAAPEVVLYQVINHTREEMFFGTTPGELQEAVAKIAKDKNGPMKDWQEGDIVQWRPLGVKMDESVAKSMHQSIQLKTPPNNYKVLQTPV